MSYTFLAIGLRWRRKTWNMNSGSVAKGSCGKSGSYGNPSWDVVGDNMSTRSGDAAFAPESRRSDFVPDFPVRGRSVMLLPPQQSERIRLAPAGLFFVFVSRPAKRHAVNLPQNRRSLVPRRPLVDPRIGRGTTSLRFEAFGPGRGEGPQPFRLSNPDA